MDSRADKLPKGRSYPLKPSVLINAVEASGLTIPVELTRWDKFDHVFKATFYPSGSRPGREGDFFWVYCRAVSSERAAEARALVEAEAIPQFIEWAKNIEKLDTLSTIRREKPTFEFSLERFAA